MQDGEKVEEDEYLREYFNILINRQLPPTPEASRTGRNEPAPHVPLSACLHSEILRAPVHIIPHAHGSDSAGAARASRMRRRTTDIRTPHALPHAVIAVRADDQPVQPVPHFPANADDEMNVKPVQTWYTCWSCWSRCLCALTCVSGIVEGCRTQMHTLFTLRHGAQPWCSSK